MSLSARVFSPSPGTSLARLFSLLALLAVAFGSLTTFSPPDASAYALEGASWPSGSSTTFQLALGNAGHTLTDGNISWDVAALPAGDAWNQKMGRLQFVSLINDSAPLSSGDHFNTIAFSS